MGGSFVSFGPNGTICGGGGGSGFIASGLTGTTTAGGAGCLCNGSVTITYTLPACTGLALANDAGTQTGTPNQSGSWSFTLTLHNCTGGDLHALNLQGGTAGWLSSATATTTPPTGTVTAKPNKNNTNQVESWSFASLPDGSFASITVIGVANLRRMERDRTRHQQQHRQRRADQRRHHRHHLLGSARPQLERRTR
jgi:hypothetical protein